MHTLSLSHTHVILTTHSCLMFLQAGGPRRGRTPPPRKDIPEEKPQENELFAKLKKRRNKGNEETSSKCNTIHCTSSHSILSYLHISKLCTLAHGRVKNYNRLKKFMQVEVDVECMQIKFGGHGIFVFGDFAPFHLPSNLAKFPFRGMGYSPW